MIPPTDRSATPSEGHSEVSALLTRADVAVVQLTAAGTIVSVNAPFETLVGHGSDDLVETPFEDVLDPTSPSLDPIFDAQLPASDTLTLPVSVKTADGDVVPCQSLFTPIAGDGGADRGIVGLLSPAADPAGPSDALERNPDRTDETARARAFVALADAIPDGVIVLDTGSQIQYANAAVERILGYDPAALVGSSKLTIIPEHLREAHVEGLRRYLESGERNVDWDYSELPGQHKDGHEVPLGISLGQFTFGGEPYFVGLFRDVSERKAREQALEESNERLEQFAYAASHDMQEPLRMVSTYLQLIERRYSDRLDDEGEEFLEYAIAGADRMRAMIEALLEYSRVETGGRPFETVDLEGVLTETIENLRVQIEDTGGEIDSGPLPRVTGDPDQLRQVFQNLLSNAIVYSGDEPPRIHVEAERRRETWIVSVRDEGIGIPADAQDRIFDVFERLHSRQEYEGTGIGLALCQRIVERHGGDLWVDSTPGVGSTFSISLPASDEN